MSARKIESAFWDTSALVPICCSQPGLSVVSGKFAPRFKHKIIWWGASVELHSSLQRLHREKVLDATQLAMARGRWDKLSNTLLMIEPTARLHELATTFPALYDLRALDSFQLAAALIWCKEKPRRRPFVCFDKRLAEAATKAGFTVLTD